MEGTTAHQPCPARPQCHTLGCHDGLYGVPAFYLIDIVVHHSSSPSRSASSAGSVVAKLCSKGLATTLSGTRPPWAMNSPSPFLQDKRNSRSPALSRKV